MKKTFTKHLSYRNLKVLLQKWQSNTICVMTVKKSHPVNLFAFLINIASTTKQYLDGVLIISQCNPQFVDKLMPEAKVWVFY